MQVISGKTKVFGVIGHPIAHTRSPELHNRWFQDTGFDGVYAAFDVQEQLESALTGLWHAGVAGLNITAPWKKAAASLCVATTDEVQFLGAANTLVRTEQGWRGHNTDIYGFRKAFEKKFGSMYGRTIAIYGCGGAGKAVAYACGQAQAAQIHIVNRTVETAEQECERLATQFPSSNWIAHIANEIPDVLIYAASDGEIDRLSVQNIFDLRYDETTKQRRATWAQQGKTVLDGFTMLIYQGARAFEIFTGIYVDSDPTICRTG